MDLGLLMFRKFVFIVSISIPSFGEISVEVEPPGGAVVGRFSERAAVRPAGRTILFFRPEARKHAGLKLYD